MDTVATQRPEGFTRHRALIAVAMTAVVIEAMVLTVCAPAARSLAPQVTALSPLAAFHDLRWLFAADQPLVRFLACTAALLLLRAGLDAVLIRLAWPYGRPKPRFVATAGSCAALTIVVWLLLSPVVTLVFGVALVPFSWPFLAALPVLLGIALSLSHGGVLGSWWRQLPPWSAGGWLLSNIGVLSLAGAVMSAIPTPWATLIAAPAGLFNARVWYGMACVAARRAPKPIRAIAASRAARLGFRWRNVLRRKYLRHIPVAPLTGLLVLALVVGVARCVFVPLPHAHASAPPELGRPIRPSFARGTSNASTDPAVGTREVRGAVLMVGGFGSPCCDSDAALQTVEPDLLVRQFSYRGLDADGRPIPHGQSATDMPLPVLGDRMAEQIRRLHELVHGPVDLVAESEGTLGVYAAVVRHPDLPLGDVALLSPIIEPGHGYTGTAGTTSTVSGSALLALNRVLSDMTPYGRTGAQTLISSVNQVGAQYFSAASHSRKSTWLVVMPLADAVTLPVCEVPPHMLVVPAFHGGLLGDRRVLGIVASFLAGRPLADGGESEQNRLHWTVGGLAALASSWRMPDVRRCR